MASLFETYRLSWTELLVPEIVASDASKLR